MVLNCTHSDAKECHWHMKFCQKNYLFWHPPFYRITIITSDATLAKVYPRGGYSTKFYMGRLRPEDQPRSLFYYKEESVLLGTKPLVDSIRHFIRDPSGVFSVCHLCECCIVQWRHDSRLLLLFNWFLHIIKRTLHIGSKIWILCSRGKNNISLVRFAHWWDIVLATPT